jgi:hypothetical protein
MSSGVICLVKSFQVQFLIFEFLVLHLGQLHNWVFELALVCQEFLLLGGLGDGLFQCQGCFLHRHIPEIFLEPSEEQ